MGLDMYLSKRYYVKNWSHMEPGELHHITILKGDKPSSIPADRISYIETEEICWRKANAIHKWFVDNIQNGEDDCRPYYASREDLQRLLALCNKVLAKAVIVQGNVKNGETWEQGKPPVIHYENGRIIANPEVISEILPTQEGFFFGSTDYDEYYLRDIELTKTELERLLAVEDDADFQYHASW